MGGLTESRLGTVSVFNGPPAEVILHDTVEDEQAAVAQCLAQRLAEGIQPKEIGVIQ